MRSFKDIQLLSIWLSEPWVVHHNRLMDLEPFDAASVEHPIESGWQLLFTEDLFAATNEEKGLAVDVGWFPDGDPQGSFVISLCTLRNSKRRNGSTRLVPGEMIRQVRTRRLAEVVQAIDDLVEQRG